MPCTHLDDCGPLQLVAQEVHQMKERVGRLQSEIERAGSRFDAFQSWLIGILATSLVGLALNIVLFLLTRK